MRQATTDKVSGSDDVIGVPTVVLLDRLAHVEPQVSSIVRDKVDPDSVNTGASFTSVSVTVNVPKVIFPPPSVTRRSKEKDF